MLELAVTDVRKSHGAAAPSACASALASPPQTIPVDNVKDVPEDCNRCLRRGDSETEEVAAEKIAKAAKEAFDAGRIRVTDRSAPTTVEFWLSSWLDHLDELRGRCPGTDLADFVAGLHPYNRDFARFFVTQLLQTSKWSDVRAMLPLFVRLATDCGPLWPPMGHVILHMAQAPPASPLDFNGLGLSLQNRAKLFRCSLYSAYLSEREDERMRALLGTGMVKDAKLKLIDEMLETCQDDGKRSLLSFGKAFYCLDSSACMAWLLESKDRPPLINTCV